MKHNIENYQAATSLIKTIDEQMSENIIVRMDDEPNHKKRTKLVKEIEPVSNVIYPMQVRMTQIKTNLLFVLENAVYNKSYAAAAKYFAEYDFLSQQITKEAKKVKNNEAMEDFLQRSTVLNEDYFKVMMETINVMKHLVIHRMNREPEIYIDLDPIKDSELDFDHVKQTYKSTLKKLKEDLKKQQQGK